MNAINKNILKFLTILTILAYIAMMVTKVVFMISMSLIQLSIVVANISFTIICQGMRWIYKLEPYLHAACTYLVEQLEDANVQPSIQLEDANVQPSIQLEDANVQIVMKKINTQLIQSMISYPNVQYKWDRYKIIHSYKN